MRRHRQKSTLLPKMIGVAVLVNAILLPIMAEFGVFHKGHGQRLTQVSLVKLPPPEKSPAERKRAKRPVQNHNTAHGSKPHAGSSKALPPNPNQPKVVAAAGGDTGSDEPTIANNGTAAPGQVTVAPTAASAPPHSATPAQIVEPPAQPKHVSPPSTAGNPTPQHQPIIIAAQPINRPEPTIPDELLTENRSASFLALFAVKANGKANVSIVKGTGNSTLDQRALDAAREWTFRPATRDGQPVDSYLRLRIDFKVSD